MDSTLEALLKALNSTIINQRKQEEELHHQSDLPLI